MNRLCNWKLSLDDELNEELENEELELELENEELELEKEELELQDENELELELNDDDELEPHTNNSMLVMSLEAPLESLPQNCGDVLGPKSTPCHCIGITFGPATTATLLNRIFPSLSLRV